MKTITIVCAGKLKEAYWRDAAGEYAKRLQSYCDLKIVETPDEKAPERLSEAMKQSILLPMPNRFHYFAIGRHLTHCFSSTRYGHNDYLGEPFAEIRQLYFQKVLHLSIRELTSEKI